MDVMRVFIAKPYHIAGGQAEARSRAGGAGCLLDNGVPLPARLALALPAPANGTAVLAHAGGGATSHAGNREQARREANCGERADPDDPQSSTGPSAVLTSRHECLGRQTHDRARIP